MHPDIYNTCPFCKEKALVSSQPVQGLPSTIYEVICKMCGHFCVLSRLLPENLEEGHPLSDVKRGGLDLEKIYLHNSSALSEGKMMIWVDDKENIIEWEQAIKRGDEKAALIIPQLKSYAVRDVTSFIKS